MIQYVYLWVINIQGLLRIRCKGNSKKCINEIIYLCCVTIHLFRTYPTTLHICLLLYWENGKITIGSSYVRFQYLSSHIFGYFDIFIYLNSTNKSASFGLIFFFITIFFSKIKYTNFDLDVKTWHRNARFVDWIPKPVKFSKLGRFWNPTLNLAGFGIQLNPFYYFLT